MFANVAAQKLCPSSNSMTCYALAHRTHAPCDSSQHPCPLEHIKRTKQPVVSEHIHYDKAGKPRNVEIHGYPIFDHQGNLVQMIEYTLDITGHKHADRHLQQLEKAIETIPLGVTITDLNGQIIYTNPADAAMHGYRMEELFGKNAEIFAPAEFRKPRNVEEIQHWKGLIRESVNIRKDGSRFPVWLMSEIIQDPQGKPYAIVTTCEDISDRKQTEDALRETEARFRSIFENAVDGIFQSSPEGRLLSANPALATIHGYDSPEEFLFAITDLEQQLYVNPDDRAIFRRVLQEQGRIMNFETQMYRKDGSVIWVSISARTVLDSQGKIWCYEGILVDITQRKQIQDELQTYREHLEELVEQRATELMATNERLRQEISERKRAEEALQRAKEVAENAQEAAEHASQAKSEFLAHMSHELRTPLNAILGYTQILTRNEDLTEKQMTAVRTIHESSEHLLSIINELLDLARIEEGKLNIEPANVYLSGFLHNLAEIVRVRAQQKRLQFQCDVASDLPAGISVDEKRLRQVLLNLLNNAIKFTEAGMVSLRIVETGRRSGSTNIRFEVKDTGPGIPAEAVEEIFIPFHRGHNAHVAIEGTGLGLPISRKLIQMMGSELHVKSTLGQGSLFWFELDVPIVEGITEAYQNQPRIAGFRGDSYTLLIVDDNKPNRAILKEMLAPLGFDIVEAVDGHDGLAKVADFRPDLIFMDLMMPDMNGIEAVQRLRRDSENTGIPIIGISASAFETTRQASLEAGCNDFLMKPVQLQALLDTIQANLSIEWLYEQQPEIPSIEVGLLPQESVLLFPEDELTTLYEWTILGDIERIVEHMKALEAEHPEWTACTSRVCRLAEAFFLDDLEKLVQQSLSSHS